MAARPRSVLQIGCGSFGPTHLEAWRRLGLRGSLWVADPDPEARARAAAGDVPAERIVANYREVLGAADVVDIVAATDRHVEICLAACTAGCGDPADRPFLFSGVPLGPLVDFGSDGPRAPPEPS